MYALALFFFFNDTATTEIYTLSLHDALPICREAGPDRAEDEVAGGHCRCAPEDERCPLGAGRPAGGHRDRGAAGPGGLPPAVPAVDAHADEEDLPAGLPVERLPLRVVERDAQEDGEEQHVADDADRPRPHP